MMTWALIAGGGVVGVGLLAFVAGSLLPRGHVARVRARFSQSPERLWATITDLSGWPSWNPHVKKTERQPDQDGKPVWLVRDANGAMPSRIERLQAPAADQPGEMVTRIDDPKLPFGGSWTWTVVRVDGGTEVTIREDGEIKSPIFRLMSKLFFDPHDTATQYLASLGKKHGEDVAPARLD